MTQLFQDLIHPLLLVPVRGFDQIDSMAGVWFLPPLTSSTNGGFNSQLLFSFSYYISSFDQKSLSKWVEDLSLSLMLCHLIASSFTIIFYSPAYVGMIVDATTF
ncbi:hypothetical protein C4D60_Mb10t11240 [Musa balbisiana]|uniref:Uncharacterized protein n=1 Tax=Musa balbisiana TaxID=52838 RepID=A0A4S8IWA0_MUSBA|nr:hypothetical protein C4D60_Mb10t11240 [Musa balbisiana]